MDQLASGAGTLADGASALSDGTSSLASGVGTTPTALPQLIRVQQPSPATAASWQPAQLPFPPAQHSSSRAVLQ
ncbi:MAG: hypothetical protein ACLUSL_08640 [Ruminococcus sp.]